MISRVLVSLLIMGASFACDAKDIVIIHQPPQYQTNPQQAIQDVRFSFNMWLAAINSGSVDNVVKLYATNALLLPTLSPKICTKPDEIKDYFTKLLTLPNLRVIATEDHIRLFGELAISSGLYTFSYTKDKQTVEIPARFTFFYHRTARGWLILEHHSSKVPVL